MVSGSRRGSDVSDLSEEKWFFDDGIVSPISSVAPLRPTKSSRTPTPQDKGKQAAPRLPPLPVIDPMSPVISPRPRVASSVYPEDEMAATLSISDFPLPPIPAKFRDEQQQQQRGRQALRGLPPPVPAKDARRALEPRSSSKASSRRAEPMRPVSEYYPADDEDDEGGDWFEEKAPVLPPLKFEGRKRTGGKKSRAGVLREEEGMDSDSGSDNRRSSFYSLEGEIFKAYQKHRTIMR